MYIPVAGTFVAVAANTIYLIAGIIHIAIVKSLPLPRIKIRAGTVVTTCVMLMAKHYLPHPETVIIGGRTYLKQPIDSTDVHAVDLVGIVLGGSSPGIHQRDFLFIRVQSPQFQSYIRKRLAGLPVHLEDTQIPFIIIHTKGLHCLRFLYGYRHVPRSHVTIGNCKFPKHIVACRNTLKSFALALRNPFGIRHGVYNIKILIGPVQSQFCAFDKLVGLGIPFFYNNCGMLVIHIYHSSGRNPVRNRKFNVLRPQISRGRQLFMKYVLTGIKGNRLRTMHTHKSLHHYCHV